MCLRARSSCGSRGGALGVVHRRQHREHAREWRRQNREPDRCDLACGVARARETRAACEPFEERAIHRDVVAPKSPTPDDQARDKAAQEFADEAVKLKQLREALWAAFEAGPAAGLPNTLIDLTIAYTNALRLQLNLRSVTMRQAQYRPTPLQRSETAAKS